MHRVQQLEVKDMHTIYTWAVMWDYIIVCYAPNKEWAEHIAHALDHEQEPYLDDKETNL